MVQLPGKGVRGSQDRSFAFQAGLAVGNQLCPGGPRSARRARQQIMLLTLLACHLLTGAFQHSPCAVMFFFLSIWLLSVDHPDPSENTQLPPQKVTLFKIDGKKLRNYLHSTLAGMLWYWFLE